MHTSSLDFQLEGGRREVGTDCNLGGGGRDIQYRAGIYIVSFYHF